MLPKTRRGLLGWSALLILPAVLLSAGCGEEEVVDPYVYGSVDQVTRGFVRSDLFLYEIDAPQFVFAHGNTAIIRSGTHLEVLVGDDLENRAPQLSGKLLGVQKFFSPYVWLMAKRVKDGISITELDSVPDPVLPRFTDVKLDEVSGYDIGQLRWNQKEKIDDMLNAEVQTVGTLEYLPDHQAEQPEATEGAEPVEPEMAWYLRAESSDAIFKITNVTPALEFAFKLIQAEEYPFVGGVMIQETYPFAERRQSRVSAPIEVQWLKYANRYLAP